MRQRMTTGLLAFALAALALFGAFLGEGWDGYSIGLVVVAVALVALGIAALMTLRQKGPQTLP